jgi:hypothetical protein
MSYPIQFRPDASTLVDRSSSNAPLKYAPSPLLSVAVLITPSRDNPLAKSNCNARGSRCSTVAVARPLPEDYSESRGTEIQVISIT